MDIKERFETVWDNLAVTFGSAQHTITFTIESGSTFNPVTGKMTGGSSTNYTAKGWFGQFKEGQFKEWIVGDAVFEIKQADLVDSGGTPYVPEINDRPTIGGESYNVIEIIDDKCGGDAGGGVTYKLQLRGG